MLSCLSVICPHHKKKGGEHSRKGATAPGIHYESRCLLPICFASLDFSFYPQECKTSTGPPALHPSSKQEEGERATLGTVVSFKSLFSASVVTPCVMSRATAATRKGPALAKSHTGRQIRSLVRFWVLPATCDLLFV